MLVPLTLWSVLGVAAPADPPPAPPPDPPPAQLVGATLAYYGETLSHPGVMLGAVFLPVHSPSYRHALLVRPQLGWYLHPHNHHGLFVDAELGYRFRADRKAKGFTTNVQAGLGYHHSFVTGLVYTREGDEILARRDRGRPTFMPSGSLGLGYDLSARALAPVEPFVQLQMFGRYPFNGYTLFGFAVQVGVTVYFELRRPKR